MKYKIWDYLEGRFLTETESQKFGIGTDGKLYEFNSKPHDRYAWASKTVAPITMRMSLNKIGLLR
ncbi:hypothetical protein MHB54_00535 [Paenibacillus sp. FSL M7-0802]|uniref:hypothetical protein n=1 Tax=Paenibacillus sp. FSL M7-0802 TaxID=2921536 RepID=UPI0030FB72F7